MYIVYILQSTSSGVFYIGQTNNLERRLEQHNDASKKSWASKHGPWRIFYTETFSTRLEAMRRERYLKSLKSREKILELDKARKMVY